MNASTHEEIMKSFNRNALGRLVSNSETVQGLPVTTKDTIEHLSMDEQITLLTNRLEEIGGSKYRAAEFEFDEGPCWPGFTVGQTWNGWACPYFTKEVAMNILDWMAEGNTEGEGTIYEETENTLTIIDLQYPEEPYTIEATEEGLYNLGGSWTWSEKEQETIDEEENTKMENRIFLDRADMEKFVMDYFTLSTTDYDLTITITAHPTEDSDYDCDQVIPFHVTGACEYNLMMDLCNILDGEGYTLVFTCNK